MLTFLVAISMILALFFQIGDALLQTINNLFHDLDALLELFGRLVPHQWALHRP